MKKLVWTIWACAALCTPAAAQYTSTAGARMERELNYICSTSIGAVPGSQDYVDCRLYYDRLLWNYGIDYGTIQAYQITEFLNRTTPFISRCRNQGIASALIWGCLRDYEDRYYLDWSKRHPRSHHSGDYRPRWKNPYEGHSGKKHSGKPDKYEPHRPDHKPDKKPSSTHKEFNQLRHDLKSR